MSTPPVSSQNTGESQGCWKRYLHMRMPDRYDGILVLGILLYALYFSNLSLFMYNNFLIEFDMAIFNQAFWNTVTNGQLFTNSLEGAIHSLSSPSHFGVHFSPVLFFLVPLYAIVPVPQTLLISQSILLALGAVPIYLTGRELLGEKAGCAIGLLYLIYPSLHGVNLHDFHELAFLPFLLGMGLWCFLTGRNNGLLIFGFLSLLVKEDISLIIIMLGIVGLFLTRGKKMTEKWQYLVLILMAVFTLTLFYGVIRPMFTPASFIESGFLPTYFNPDSSFSQYNTGRIMYLLMTFAPLVFVPLAAPEILVMSLPPFAEILLSPVYHFYNIGYHYSALIIPILFIATIRALARIQQQDTTRERHFFIPVLCIIIISSLICTALYSPAVKMNDIKGETDENAMNIHQEFVDHVISLIPRDASVSTQYNILPRVSARDQIWLDYTDSADVIMIDSAFPDRSKDFDNDIEKIGKAFDLVLHENYLYIYVNKNQTSLKSELENKFNQ